MTVNGSQHPDCPNCGGQGTRQEGGPCPACKGTGREPGLRPHLRQGRLMYVIQRTEGAKMVRAYIGVIADGALLVATIRTYAKVFPTIEEARVVYRRLADPRHNLIVPAEEDRK